MLAYVIVAYYKSYVVYNILMYNILKYNIK